MVERDREVINKENPEFQNTPPFFSFSGWGDKNRMSPVPVLSGTQRRLFYSLQPFDFFLFEFSDILMVIATMHNFSCPLRTNNSRLLVNYFSVKLRIREFLLIRAYQTQGCSRSDISEPAEKTVHRICLSQIRQNAFGLSNQICEKEAITFPPLESADPPLAEIRKELL